jgi:hypothetical protein
MMRLLTAFLILLFCVPALFAAYPDEYPIFLHLLGFSKEEIRDLQDGGVVSRTIRNGLPGEYGVVTAKVYNVPAYYIRDYYNSIESFRGIQDFREVGKFKPAPDLDDLGPLHLQPKELEKLAACRPEACEWNLSAGEISLLPSSVDAESMLGSQQFSAAFRKILLARLLAYQKNGVDDEQETSILQTHLSLYPDLTSYFPDVKLYILEYPRHRDIRVPEFFYWSRDQVQGESVISIHHVFSQRIGEDFILLDRLIYSNRLVVSSISVVHLIHYVEKQTPRTLCVLEQRTLTDKKGKVFGGSGQKISSGSLEKRFASLLKSVGIALEQRYLDRSYVGFPFGMQPADQR